MSAPATRRSTPRDRYQQQLPADSLAQLWEQAGRHALRERLAIKPSFRELAFFDSATPVALGYRLRLRRGQQVRIAYQAVDSPPGAVFADVFEEIQPPSAMFRHVFSSDPNASSFEFEASSDGEYVIRLQPALEWQGLREVIVASEAGLIFPVRESSLQSVGSWFGDARDGGKRDHEGIDIFAPRGTSVVAVADGVIESVETTSVGGRVVWQYDRRRDVTYYYAHLNTQQVNRGDAVRAGDRIGTVGNTGNAAASRPHLHFAIYRPGRSAVDPVPFLHDQSVDSLSAVAADASALGNWTRVVDEGVLLRLSPAGDAGSVTRLPRHAQVRLIGAVRDWHRVALEDGTTGFLGAWQIEHD